MVNSIDCAEGVEHFTEEIMNAIKLVADNTIPKSRYSTFDNKWFSQELTRLRNEVNKIRKKLNKTRGDYRQVLYQNYAALRSVYKTKIKDAKTMATNERLESIDKTNLWNSETIRKEVMLF